MSRVNILGDFQQMGYDQTNAALFSLWDYGHIFIYPAILGGEKNTIAGRDGDKFLVQLPFQIEQAPNSAGVKPVLNSVVVSVVATKTGKADFIVESQTFNVGTSCIYQGQQNPKIKSTRNYITFPGDPYNTVTLAACKTYNPSTGTKKGYLLQYPFTLRYDYWNSINPNTPGTGNCSTDINNDILNVNNSWSNLATNGWSLFLRYTVNVQGYDNYITPFQYQQAIACAPMGSPPMTGANYSVIPTFYDVYGVVQPGIIPGAKTRVSLQCLPDVIGLPAGYDGYIGTMFMDLLNSGGVYTRRFASTELPSESGSPWSPCPKNGSPDIYYANGNLSINIWNATGIVIIEGFYDDSVLNWFTNNNMPAFGGGIQLKDSALQTAGATDINTAGNSTILP